LHPIEIIPNALLHRSSTDRVTTNATVLAATRVPGYRIILFSVVRRLRASDPPSGVSANTSEWTHESLDHGEARRRMRLHDDQGMAAALRWNGPCLTGP